MNHLETEKYEQNDLVMRYRPPENKNSTKLLILLHGWTGNEDVMWIFARNVPEDRWIIAPRGIISAPEGGYGWAEVKAGEQPSLFEFHQAVDSLLSKIERWSVGTQVDTSHFALMGFSQGAIMSYALTFLYPQKVDSVAALAGYFPSSWMDAGHAKAIKGIPFYIAHGTQDETVPISLARKSVSTLEKAGAAVTYCESEAGHKLSMACLHGLDDFLSS